MITIFADASVCSDTLAAGWGAWAKRDGWWKGEIFGGPLKGSYVRSSDAEIAALAKAVFRLKEEGKLDTTVMLQSDSLRALSVIAQGLPSVQIRNHANGCPIVPARNGKTKVECQAMSLLMSALSSREVFLRHVRGHQKGSGRQWVNTQCDREARKHMAQLRSGSPKVSPEERKLLLDMSAAGPAATHHTARKPGQGGVLLRKAFRFSTQCSVCGMQLSKATGFAAKTARGPTLFCEQHYADHKHKEMTA